MSAAQLSMPAPVGPPNQPVQPETYWAWCCAKNQPALACLVEAKRHRRQFSGDEVLEITVCSSLAAQLPPDTAVTVTANDRVPANCLYCTVETRR
jgi:hypothetical protein